MDGVQDLRLLFASHHALIVAALDDERRFMGYACRAADLWVPRVDVGSARPRRDLRIVRGQSEERLRTALATVEAMGPVVLWIDEIEKGFPGGSSDADAGAARRVLGGFLRWLQEPTGRSLPRRHMQPGRAVAP